MRAAGSDRRSGRSAADEDTVTARDDAVYGFTRFGVNSERLVAVALFKLETPHRLRGVGRFVNVNRHRVDNLHANVDVDRLFSMNWDVSQLSLNESCNCTDRSVPGRHFSIRKGRAVAKGQISEGASLAEPPPLRHHYLDELAVRFVRRRKSAAADREIDLLLPFVAAKMRRDVSSFVVVRGQGRGVGNELVPCSRRSVPDGNHELSAK